MVFTLEIVYFQNFVKEPCTILKNRFGKWYCWPALLKTSLSLLTRTWSTKSSQQMIYKRWRHPGVEFETLDLMVIILQCSGVWTMVKSVGKEAE